MPVQFDAPWETRLKLMTAVALAVLAFVFFTTARDLDQPASYLGLAVVLGVVGISLAFMVTGYSVRDGQLLIHHPGWATRFDLAQVREVKAHPGATAGSLRTFGIGGFLGYIGHFRNDLLGAYRAYVTSAAHTVVLRIGSDVIVVSPEQPQAFADAVQAAAPQPA